MAKTPHSDMTPETLMEEVAKAQLDISVSLQRVLAGYIKEMNGPEKFGEELAKLSRDDELNASARVSIMNNITKLMGQYANKANDNDLEDKEQLQAILKQSYAGN